MCIRDSCITVPLSASTCAGWTALSNIYTPDGKFVKDVTLKSCPNLLIFDHTIVRAAPPRTLASGMADAVAKWYESSLTSNTSQDGFVQQAVQMARVLRDQLFLNGHKAFSDPSSNSWKTVAEGCALTAGIIGGLGGARCRTAAAHPIHNGLTQLAYTNKPLHGELVGFGLLVQLHLEENNSNSQLPKQAKFQLLDFFSQLNLPISIESICLRNTTSNELYKACKFACNDDSDIHQLPFPINEKDLLGAMRQDGAEIKELKIDGGMVANSWFSQELANVLSGGETTIDKTLSEEDLYKLELDSFMRLIETKETQQRIKHTLSTGKPLVN